MRTDAKTQKDAGELLPPDYFQQIRDKARSRWEQLEADPDLAAPWHQLFKQVQYPRQIVSELLQNADDAGATEADIRIVDGEFIFSHDGNDFQESEFASLCRFGYSNKRSLHTIGFRGIGFKSTFSLGDEVQLRTPTLSVAYFRERFSEPVWINNTASEKTEIRVAIKDGRRQKEIEKNFDEWMASPASLLFFNSIRQLRIGDQIVGWDRSVAGPVPKSKWITSSTSDNQRFLLVHSEEVEFPPEAIQELRDERMIAADDEADFPPCRVELVLGMEGRLFVILPTGVRTDLPFACNAPFIQDPARVKIKDPATSPTNQWLLARIGALAAVAMTEWLDAADLPPQDRCGAYAFLPDSEHEENTIEGTSAAIVEDSFAAAVGDRPVLLTEDASVVGSKECVALPTELLTIWPTDRLSEFFDDAARPLLSRHINDANREKLSTWDLIDDFERADVLTVLKQKQLPRPESWRQLLSLWSYLADDICRKHYHGNNNRNAAIIPAQGGDLLFAADGIVRLGEKRLLQSDDDWIFLSGFLRVLNPNWPRFLAEQRRKADEEQDDELQNEWAAAQRILSHLELGESSDVSRVIDTVAEQAFSQDEYPARDCIRIAQIAAKLGATVTNKFEYVTQNEMRTVANETIVADLDGDFDQFVSESWYEEHVLQDDYNTEFMSCTENEWRQWVSSGKSQLSTFVPFVEFETKFHRRKEVETFLQKRGVNGELTQAYVKPTFVIDDFDFDDEHWELWAATSDTDDGFWARVVSRILQQRPEHIREFVFATASNAAKSGSRKPLTREAVRSAWLTKFRELPCLIDTRGQYRRPAELLRRTPETEPLLGVEPFVRAEDDNEHTRGLLDLLGVGCSPTGPDRLLEFLRAIAGDDETPVYEVEKWYHRLAQLFVKCTTDEAQTIKDAFANEDLILTGDGEWVTTAEVFLNAAEDDVPGAALVHPSVQPLSLWQKIGVSDRPTADLSIEWLQELPTDQKLDADELRRVRALLPRFPLLIWEECHHWLTLDGHWANVSTLKYSLTMQSLVRWSHLFEPFKQLTADLQKLPAETCGTSPFVDLPTLASCIDHRFREETDGLPPSSPREWLHVLGSTIARISTDNPERRERITQLGQRMAATQWQIATGLESVPYIDGTPAGTPQQISVLWKGEVLYVQDRPVAQLFKDITQELMRVFERSDIAEAIRACVERSPEFIEEYFAENFDLVPAEITTPQSHDPNSAVTTPDNTDTDPTLETKTSVTTEQNVAPSVPNGADMPLPDSPTDGDQNHLREPAIDLSLAVDAEHNNRVEPSAVDDEPEQEKPEKPEREAKAKLIERFAASAGLTWSPELGLYVHEKGLTLRKAPGPYPWQIYSPKGHLKRSYWFSEQCLTSDTGIELNAEIWNLLSKSPEAHAFILLDEEGNPKQWLGPALVKLVEGNTVGLFPAKYRLRVE